MVNNRACRAIKCQEYWVNEARKADKSEHQLNTSMNAGISLNLGLTPDHYEQARKQSLRLLQRMVDCMRRAHTCYKIAYKELNQAVE